MTSAAAPLQPAGAADAVELAFSLDAAGRCSTVIGDRLFDGERDVKAMERALAALPRKQPV